MIDLFERACQGARSVLERVSVRPRTGLILGSGLGAFADALENAVSIPYSEIPGFVAPTVSGHAGCLVIGEVAGEPVAVMSGRIHAYEGHDLDEVTLPVRILRQMGVRRLVVTNSSGGLDPSLGAGTLMLITDHINLTGVNPLVGANEPRFGTRFPDMSYAYDPTLSDEARAAAAEMGQPLAEGVYVGVMGPSYETPAEVRMLHRLGGTVVGMSTVPEVIVANHGGLKVLGFSCISNPAAGLEDEPLYHTDVKAAAQAVSGNFVALLTATLKRIHDAPERFPQSAPEWAIEA